MIADCGSRALNFINVRWIIAPKSLAVPTYSLAYAGGVNVYQNAAVRGPAWLISNWTVDKHDSVDPQDQHLLLQANPTFITDARSPYNSPVEASATGNATGTVEGFDQHAPDKVSIDCSNHQSSLVIVSQTECAGWTAKVDNRATSVTTVDDLLTGVFVPAGAHHVQLTYEPSTIRLGTYLVCVGWFIFAFGCVYQTRRPRGYKFES